LNYGHESYVAHATRFSNKLESFDILVILLRPLTVLRDLRDSRT
jgi:hypothetical protein